MAPVVCCMNCRPVSESSAALVGQLGVFVIVGEQMDM
jgi:hypothetical protein